MIAFDPASIEHLCAELREIVARGEKVARVDLHNCQKILAYAPEDMTVTVEAGITLETLQKVLARHGQWLPLDPPPIPESPTVAGLIMDNLSGPRRYGYGTVREHLLGLAVVLADGSLIRGGGRVVKNVAGYDLPKLFVGSKGTIGVVVEATLRLRPLPERELFAARGFPSLGPALTMIRQIRESASSPTVLDLEQFNPKAHGDDPERFTVTVGFAGTAEEVAYQEGQLDQLGHFQAANLDHQTFFWARPEPYHRLAVLASRLDLALNPLLDSPFLARAGNGIIYYRGEPPMVRSSGTQSGSGPQFARGDQAFLALSRRVKEFFDPRKVFPTLEDARGLAA